MKEQELINKIKQYIDNSAISKLCKIKYTKEDQAIILYLDFNEYKINNKDNSEPISKDTMILCEELSLKAEQKIMALNSFLNYNVNADLMTESKDLLFKYNIDINDHVDLTICDNIINDLNKIYINFLDNISHKSYLNSFSWLDKILIRLNKNYKKTITLFSLNDLNKLLFKWSHKILQETRRCAGNTIIVSNDIAMEIESSYGLNFKYSLNQQFMSCDDIYLLGSINDRFNIYVSTILPYNSIYMINLSNLKDNVENTDIILLIKDKIYMNNNDYNIKYQMDTCKNNPKGFIKSYIKFKKNTLFNKFLRKIFG